jgi:hypothetical protein
MADVKRATPGMKYLTTVEPPSCGQVMAAGTIAAAEHEGSTEHDGHESV